MYIVGLIILTFFAVLGLSAFLTPLLSEARNDPQLKLILEKLTASDAEIRVRRGVRLCRELRIERLICECADAEAIAVCERLKNDCRMIEVIPITA